MKSPLNRRHFLRGTGALLALPALDSIGFRAFASTTVTTPPKRLMFMGIGYGVTSQTWFPDLNDKGSGYKLPAGLKALARHKEEFVAFLGSPAHIAVFLKRADKDKSGGISVEELAGFIDSILKE